MTNSSKFTKSILRTVFLGGLFAGVIACAPADRNTTPTHQNSATEMKSDVLTKEDQAALSPEEIIQGLKDGNQRFTENNLTAVDYTAQAKKSVDGQFPEAVVLSCIDSRVPVEHAFDKAIGDIFVARVAGNVVNEDILGSIEYSTAVAGSKVIVVMGHEACGAVKASIDDVKMGNITPMLAKVKPAIDAVNNYDGEKSAANADYVKEVIHANVKHSISEIRDRSPIIKELEENGDVVIVGAYYNLETGKVTFID